MPSRSEGFGLSVVEALCACLPVIVSDQEGVLGVIDGGRLGTTFRTGDVQDLSCKIRNFLKLGTNNYLIEDAYKYAICNFDIKHTAKKYIQEYKYVINNKA